jgi:hypothetical protein
MQALSNTVKVEDLVLGRVPQPRQLDLRNICTVVVRIAPEQAKWRPSTESGRKRDMLRALAMEIRRATKAFGIVESAVCNDFHVDDSRIWALVDIVMQSGQADGILIGVDVRHTIPVEMIAAVVRRAAPNDAPLTERIRRGALQLSVNER